MNKEEVNKKLEEIDGYLATGEISTAERMMYELKKLELEMRADYYAINEAEAVQRMKKDERTERFLTTLEALIQENKEKIFGPREEKFDLDEHLTAIAQEHLNGDMEKKKALNHSIEGFLSYLQANTPEESFTVTTNTPEESE